MNYNISKYRNGNNYKRKPHYNHISRKKNEETIKEDIYGEIPRKIAQACGIKNLNKASDENAQLVLDLVNNVVNNILEQTNNKINNILNSIRKMLEDKDGKESPLKNMGKKKCFKKISRNLTINYFGEDYWLEQNLEEFVGENPDL